MQTRYELMLDMCCRAFGFTGEGRQKLEIILALLREAEKADGEDLDCVLDSLGAPAEAAENPPAKQETAAPPLLRGKHLKSPPPAKAEKLVGAQKARGGKWPPVVPKKEMMALCEAMYDALKRREVSQKQVSAEIGMNYTTLNKLLLGDAPMRQHHADMLRGWLDKQRQTVAAPKAEDDVDEAVRHIMGEDG